MVELARLERVYGRKVIQGSNPCLSAKYNSADIRADISLLHRFENIIRLHGVKDDNR